jgi:hypothetical protein
MRKVRNKSGSYRIKTTATNFARPTWQRKASGEPNMKDFFTFLGALALLGFAVEFAATLVARHNRRQTGVDSALAAREV